MTDQIMKKKTLFEKNLGNQCLLELYVQCGKRRAVGFVG